MLAALKFQEVLEKKIFTLIRFLSL